MIIRSIIEMRTARNTQLGRRCKIRRAEENAAMTLLLCVHFAKVQKETPRVPLHVMQNYSEEIRHGRVRLQINEYKTRPFRESICFHFQFFCLYKVCKLKCGFIFQVLLT